MLLRRALKDSVILSGLRRIILCVFFLKGWVAGSWRQSMFCRIKKVILKNISICFRNSFLGKVSQSDNPTAIRNTPFFRNSLLLRTVSFFYSACRDRSSVYLRFSLVFGWLSGIKQGFYLFSFKFCGIIAVTTVLSNIILVYISANEISPWGWIIRILIIILGIAGMSSSVDWKEIKDSSFFLKI